LKFLFNFVDHLQQSYCFPTYKKHIKPNMETHTAAAPNPNEDEGPLVERVAVAGICISGLAVLLRFVSRKLVKQPFLWDDWLILVAIPFSWAVAIMQIRGILLRMLDDSMCLLSVKACISEHTANISNMSTPS